MLAMRLGEMVCCIDLSAVIRATTLVELKPIPQSPSYLKGIMDFAGNNLLVVDLAERLSLSDHQSYSLDTPIVICRSAQGDGAFIVDEMLGVTRVSGGDDRHESTFDCPDKLPFKGVLKTEHGPALWLDVESAIKVFISDATIDCGPELEDLLQGLDRETSSADADSSRV